MHKHVTYIAWQLSRDELRRYRPVCQATSQRRQFRYQQIKIENVFAIFGTIHVATMLLPYKYSSVGHCTACRGLTYNRSTQPNKHTKIAYIRCCQQSACAGSYYESYNDLRHGFDFAYSRSNGDILIYLCGTHVCTINRYRHIDEYGLSY